MTDEFKPSSWQQEPQDIAKEYEAWDREQTAPEDIPTEPEEFSKGMVRRGMLNPETGMPTGASKQSKILRDNARGFSPRGKQNYERIFGHA